MHRDAVIDSVFKPVRAPTTFEETVERLGTAIRLGLLPPGTRLPAERELCAKLGIARSTLRQALVAAAKLAGLSKIDYAIVTHYHADHVGGVPQLLALMPVGTFIDHGDLYEHCPTCVSGFNAYMEAIRSGRAKRLSPARLSKCWQGRPKKCPAPPSPSSRSMICR